MVKQSGINVHKTFKLKGEADKPKPEVKPAKKPVKATAKPKVEVQSKEVNSAEKKSGKAAPGFALEFAPLIDKDVRIVLQNNESLEGVLKKAYMYTLHLKTDAGIVVFMKAAVAYIEPI